MTPDFCTQQCNHLIRSTGMAMENLVVLWIQPNHISIRNRPKANKISNLPTLGEVAECEKKSRWEHWLFAILRSPKQIMTVTFLAHGQLWAHLHKFQKKERTWKYQGFCMGSEYYLSTVWAQCKGLWQGNWCHLQAGSQEHLQKKQRRQRHQAESGCISFSGWVGRYGFRFLKFLLLPFASPWFGKRFLLGDWTPLPW